MTADESGLMRVGGVVVLSGPALRCALDAALVAVRQRKLSGLPFSTTPYEALACELRAAMAANGHADVRDCAISEPVPMDEPTVPLAEAATHLDMSIRQARRLAPQLGGRKVAGSWFVDETALRQHLEGRKQ
ncbi:hypothetical protein [Mycolicibacterium elephantis]|uniref:hypothetical protein n=1 Tax=Mycolicibacterium elephantis TaxID=81858 RepID=UPI0007EAF548|nr:hypothetical protein [Mycolicibacterium elephantis]OBB16174.1 hypothetical protein A5762_04265 [Mycolicibacterium elephantis]